MFFTTAHRRISGLLLIFFLMGFTPALWAQEVVIQEPGIQNQGFDLKTVFPQIPDIFGSETPVRAGCGNPAPEKSGPSSQSRMAGGLVLPFFDDFSSGSQVPNPGLWAADTASDNQVPYVSLFKGVHAPSKGVLTMDGAGVNNKYYNSVAGSGEADRLMSEAIDLSALSPGSNVWLSFYLEPGGKGDKPEATDSFVVFFDTTGNGDYAHVWSIKGDSLPNNRFTPILIPLDQSVYFHSAFRFGFQSYGSLNGEFDQWHVDYVYMAQGRNAGDTLFNDISVISFDQGLLSGHTAVPSDHQPMPDFAAFTTEISNLKGSAFSNELRIRMSDATGGNTLTGDLGDTSAVSVGAVSFLAAPAGPFTNQSFTQAGTLRFTATVDAANADARDANDTLIVDYAIDSLYALDDGIADIGYGLTASRSFCQEYRVPAPDTLTAVWIHFVPTVYYNGTSTPLEGKAFYLCVWEKLIPDSAQVQQLSGSNVIYPSAFNGFARYPLLSPQLIDSTFWVGLEQYDFMPIGVGFDKNFVNDSKIYYEDASGLFINTTQQGTLMIRPEFGKAVIVGREEAQRPEQPAFVIAPHPVNGNSFTLLQSSGPMVKSCKLTLRDLQGRILFETNPTHQPFPFTVELPAELNAGVHLLTVEGQAGENFSQTLKLIAQ